VKGGVRMKMRHKVLFSTGLLFAGAALSGYFERNREDKVLVRGRVDKIFLDENRISEISVVGIKYDDTEKDKAIIRLDNSTRIIRKFTNENITSKCLKEDDLVEIIVEHNETDSNIVKPKKIILMT